MKVFLPTEPLIIDPYDVEMVYRALLHYAERLEKEATWVDTPEAKANILEEWAEYKALSLAIYNSHMMKPMCGKAVNRPNKI